MNTHTVVSVGTPNPQPSGPFSLPFCAWSVILKQIRNCGFDKLNWFISHGVLPSCNTIILKLNDEVLYPALSPINIIVFI